MDGRITTRMPITPPPTSDKNVVDFGLVTLSFADAFAQDELHAGLCHCFHASSFILAVVRVDRSFVTGPPTRSVGGPD